MQKDAEAACWRGHLSDHRRKKNTGIATAEGGSDHRQEGEKAL